MIIIRGWFKVLFGRYLPGFGLLSKLFVLRDMSYLLTLEAFWSMYLTCFLFVFQTDKGIWGSDWWVCSFVHF